MSALDEVEGRNLMSPNPPNGGAPSGNFPGNGQPGCSRPVRRTAEEKVGNVRSNRAQMRHLQHTM